MNATEPRSKASGAKKWIVIGALLLAAVAAWIFLPRERLPEFVDWVRAQGVVGAGLIAFAYILATVLLVPGSLITLAMGFIYGPVWGTALVSPASVIGATIAFFLGRTLARDWVEQKMAGSRKFRALQGAIDQQGLKILILTRLSPVFPFVLLNYAFGLTRIRPSSYVLGSWLGMLPGTILYVYLGSTLGDLTQLLSGEVRDTTGASELLKWIGLAATIAVTVVITRAARKALANQAAGVLEEHAESDRRIESAAATEPVNEGAVSQ